MNVKKTKSSKKIILKITMSMTDPFLPIGIPSIRLARFVVVALIAISSLLAGCKVIVPSTRPL